MIDLDNYSSEYEESVINTEEFKKGKSFALKYLASRMYTAREIYDRLVRKGFGKAVSEEIVTQLIEDGVINDRLYAEFYITDAVNIGYKGIYRIRQDLLHKGVAAGIIDRAAESADVDFEAALREFVEQKLSHTEIASRKDYEKFRTMLARRGYSLSEIKTVLSEYEFDFKE